MTGQTAANRVAPGASRLAARLPSAALAYSAEAIGTFMLVLVGTAVATAATLGKGTAGAAYNSLAVALSFGAILIPIVGALGRISGAHVNPAVTLGLAMAGTFSWQRVPGYVAAQIVGAIVAALLIWVTYGHGAYADSHLGAPAPVNGAGGPEVLIVEALIAFMLVLTVLFTAADGRVAPVAIGLALTAGVFLGGPVSGGAGNPARAIGPMIVSLHSPLWFVYVTGPLLGSALAALSFRLINPTIVPGEKQDDLAGVTARASETAQDASHGIAKPIRTVEDALLDLAPVGKRVLERVRDTVTDRPVQASLSAFGVGSAIGAALRLRRRSV